MNLRQDADFTATLEYLYSRLPMFQRQGEKAVKKGLGNTLALCAHLGNPQDKFAAVHIGGTNGKGSVSNMLASVLQESEYRVGLYTSPHLRSFTERIRVNGKPIPEEKVVEFVEAIKPKIEEIRPSFFELTVAMAFDWFARSEVEIAVVEVGLGGVLDSTNILNPVLCAITNISFDHTGMLGNTLAKIAGQKAGIIKPGVPVVIGELHPETQDVFLQKAGETKSEIRFVSQHWRLEILYRDLEKQVFEVIGPGRFKDRLTLGLSGHYQLQNLPVALEATLQLRRLGWMISPGALRRGLERIRSNTGFRGRMEKLSDQPLTICDVAHNEAGIAKVMQQIRQLDFFRMHCVIGMAEDKDIVKILSFFPKDARYYFVRPDVPRGLDARKLAEFALELGLLGKVYPSVTAGLQAAQAEADPEDLIYVGGSTFVVAEVV